MTATYTCLACGEPIQAGAAVIVGVDIGGYPDRLPVNVVAHPSCEDRARNEIAKALDRKRTMPVDGTLQA